MPALAAAGLPSVERFGFFRTANQADADKRKKTDQPKQDNAVHGMLLGKDAVQYRLRSAGRQQRLPA
jgi:hypothetical protein